MNILVFGDSITQGFWDDVQSGWCNRLAAHEMQRALTSDFEAYNPVFNLGISGNRSNDLAKRFEDEVETRKEEGKQLVLLAVGVNDSAYNREEKENWCSIDEFESNVAAMVGIAKKYGRVMLVGIAPVDEEVLDPIPWFPGYSYLPSEVNRYNEVLKRIAAEHSAIFISMDDVFEGDVKGKTVDGIHPNAEGHRLMFERIKKALEEHGILTT